MVNCLIKYEYFEQFLFLNINHAISQFFFYIVKLIKLKKNYLNKKCLKMKLCKQL